MHSEDQQCDNFNEIRAYRERYVAFIDILGFSNHVEKSKNDRELFNTLRTMLSSKVPTADRARPKDIQSYQFSDSIVISTKNDEEGLKEIIKSVHLICDRLLYHRLLTRGGITKGKLFVNPKAVFGPSLIRAYHIEKDIAIYPRILMDNCIYKDVNKISYRKSHFRRDFDARYHLDILKLGSLWECYNMDNVSVGYNKSPIIAGDKEGWLKIIKEFIEETLEKQKNNKSIIDKYVWMAKYFNSFLEKEKEFDIAPIKSSFLKRRL